MRPLLPPALLRILLFLTFDLFFVLGAPAASFQMTRRQTGQEHSYLVERLIAKSSRSYRPPTRKSVVAGIGRRAIVKGTYGSKVVPRQNGASKEVSSSVISAAATSESVVTSQSDSSASSPGTEELSQSLAGAGVTGSSTDMGHPSATGELSIVGQTETRETDTSFETNYLKVVASASVTNSVTMSATEEAWGLQSSSDFDLISRISAFISIAPSATDSVSNDTSDSESNSGTLSVTSSTGSISSADSLFVSATGTDASSSSSGASSQIDSTSALTTFAQSIWAQPLDPSASLTGVMSQNNAIVYTIDVTIGEGGITLPVLVDTGCLSLINMICIEETDIFIGVPTFGLRPVGVIIAQQQVWLIAVLSPLRLAKRRIRDMVCSGT